MQNETEKTAPQEGAAGETAQAETQEVAGGEILQAAEMQEAASDKHGIGAEADGD